MADTNFIDRTTVIQADWLNDVNRLHYTLLEDPATVQDIKDVLDITSGGGSQIIRKSGDTVRSNTTTLADDPHLTLPVLSSSAYAIEAYLLTSAASADPDIKIGFNLPSGATGTFTADSESSGLLRNTFDQSTSQTIELPFINDVGSSFVGFISTTGAGNITVEWAQNQLEADNLTMKKNSWFRITLIGEES